MDCRSIRCIYGTGAPRKLFVPCLSAVVADVQPHDLARRGVLYSPVVGECIDDVKPSSAGGALRDPSHLRSVRDCILDPNLYAVMEMQQSQSCRAVSVYD